MATLFTLMFLFGLGLLFGRRLGFWPYDRRYWKGCVATSAALLVGMLGSVQLRNLPAALAVTIGSVAIFTAFVICLLLLGLDDEDHAVWISLVSRLRT